ncbi:AI-2E family transporter [Neolewinella aurantiaca]|uniref:AI-2E family transporter n=1 Tax=Neolewinella aurantiaca TaxID=2602767 RepID=A0A5C7FTG4_9BACT|nr:AI-2E family transporter [Neolewinella aurantiaca]TXF88718.1 AI-2E family transporter [Neolewinella aurantiaca]
MQVTQNSKLYSVVLRLALLIFLVVVLYYGKNLLLPLVVAALLAMLLNPVQEKLKSWGANNGVSIAGAMLVLVLFFGGIFAAIGQQAVSFGENWPETQEKLSTKLNDMRTEYGLQGIIPKMSSSKSGESGSGELIEKIPVSGDNVMSFLSGSFGVLGDFLLMLIYVILLLSQKDRLREFVLRVSPDEKRGVTHRTLNESRDVVQKYLRGYVILIGILSTLYSIGFLIVGMDYAVLIALLVAVMALIPYIGNIIGGTFAVALAFSSGGDMSAVWGVIITISAAQLLESYVLTPMIVGDEVSLNPLATIICVVGMSILWGPVGAIIAIPLFAILRIIFSHIPALHDYAYLIGQE